MKFNDIINKIINDLNSTSEKIKIDLIYAFNGTGKTRISRNIVENYENNCLCFNALFQDDFTWDNDNFILKIRENSWITSIINEHGLQLDIINNFQLLYNDSLEPIFNESSTEITFNSKTIEGYDYSVKISKAEETLFILSIFYTFLDLALSELSEEEDNRTTSNFNELKYIIIDDPVSSIDDSIIVKSSIYLYNIICKYNSKISFLITTHHALFYNTFFNLINRDKKINSNSYILLKKSYEYILDKKGDTAFGYHLILKENIKEAIENNTINKSHYNMFRILLEKTTNFLGYSKYDECLPESNYKQEAIRLLNLYSHGNLPDYEYTELTDREKEILKNSFNDYVEKYKRS